MKIFADELPKCCADCEWFTPNHCSKDGRNFCLLARMPFYNTEEDRKVSRGQHKDSISDFECPLQSLSEHDKQVRKEVVQEIKVKLREKVIMMEDDTHCYPQNAIHWQDVVAILGKVEKGE